METVLPYALWYGISLVVGPVLLVCSMFIASSVHGGIEFGTPRQAIPRAFLAVAVIYALEIPLSFLPFGWAGSFLLWLAVFMKVFDLDLWEAITLTLVNWGFNLLLTFFVLGWLITRAVS
jgi:hypothetical protein